MISASRTKFLPSQFTSSWFRRFCIGAACLMAIIVLVGAQGVGKVNDVPHWFHKVEHFFYFGTMAALLAHGLGQRWFWLALIAVPLFGALDEWHQLYVPGRSSSVWDWATDLAGAAVAVYLYRLCGAGPNMNHEGTKTRRSTKDN